MAEMSEQEVAEARGCFDFYDKNKDGHIDASELGKVMRKLGHNPSKAELNDLISSLDLDSNGVITFDEFLKGLDFFSMGAADPDEELRMAFETFDKNGDGSISLRELMHALTAYGESLSKDEVKWMFQQADTDGNGKIDLQEFMKMMR